MRRTFRLGYISNSVTGWKRCPAWRQPIFEPWNEQRAAAIIAAHRTGEGPALPILHALQEAFGHIPEEAVRMVAAALNVTRAEMHGVVTFYHDFRKEPPGAHVLKLCQAEACQATGARKLAAHAARAPRHRDG